MNRRWLVGLILVAGLIPGGARAQAPTGDPVADRFSFPVGDVPNSPTTSRYVAPNGHIYLGWWVNPAVSFLSPAYGQALQPGEDWSGRGSLNSVLGQPVYAAAAGTIVAAGNYGPTWGNILLIRHTLPGGQVVLTQYAYLADIVRNSGSVQWREVIGHVGMGPRGAALHFEVRRDSMLDFPADYWPSSDGRNDSWVRTHYFSPTEYVRSHYRIFTPPAVPVAPGGTPAPTPGPVDGLGPGSGGGTTPAPADGLGPGSVGGTTTPGPVDGLGSGPTGGTAPGPIAPGPVSGPGTVGDSPGAFPLFPGLPASAGPPAPAPTGAPIVSAWDGVPHLDGSILKSSTGTYYLLDNGKKWRIPTDDVLSTWARPQEALLVSDAELASYPDGSHVLGLRSGTLFRGPNGPTCISMDPLNGPGLACWAIENDNSLAQYFITPDKVKSVSAETAALYLQPTPFANDMLLPPGTLIKQGASNYFLVQDLTASPPQLHPVTSFAALASWQIGTGTALRVWGEAGSISGLGLFDRAQRLQPVRFRPGSLLESSTGQFYVVSGVYKYQADLATLQRRGYNTANALLVGDADLALEQDWPTPLQ